MGSGSGGIRPLAAPAAYVRGRLEALHRLAEALAELGELARSEEDRGDAADDHQLGEPEAEEAHRGHAPAPRPAAPRAAGGPADAIPAPSFAGFAPKNAGAAPDRPDIAADFARAGAEAGARPREAVPRARPGRASVPAQIVVDAIVERRRDRGGSGERPGGRREARPRGANCACVRGDDLERAGGCAARGARGGALARNEPARRRGKAGAQSG